jgi:DNA-binding CsgD family transcriptional regulator
MDVKKNKPRKSSRGGGSTRAGLGSRASRPAKFVGPSSRLFSARSSTERSIVDVWDGTFDESADLILLLDEDLTIIRANRAFAETSGVELEDLVGRKCREIVRGMTAPPPASRSGEGRGTADSAAEVFYVARLGNRFLLSVPGASADRDRLLNCIRVAMEIAKPEITKRLPGITDEREGAWVDGQDRLTPRQNEILRLLCHGLLVKEIAFQLKISTRTVEFHKRKMMENIGVKTFAELIKYAIRQDIVT